MTNFMNHGANGIFFAEHYYYYYSTTLCSVVTRMAELELLIPDISLFGEVIKGTNAILTGEKPGMKFIFKFEFGKHMVQLLLSHLHHSEYFEHYECIMECIILTVKGGGYPISTDELLMIINVTKVTIGPDTIRTILYLYSVLLEEYSTAAAKTGSTKPEVDMQS